MPSSLAARSAGAVFVRLGREQQARVLAGMALPERLELDRQVTDLVRHPAYLYRGDHLGFVQHVLRESLWSKQREVLSAIDRYKRVAVVSTHSSGKDLPLDTPIPTPTGWTTMGAIRPGDQVLDAMGRPTTVTGVTGVQHNRLFEVVFSDGTRQVAGEDHQWVTLDMRDRTRVRNRNREATGSAAVRDWRLHWGDARVRTTRQIADTLLTAGGQPSHLVPVASPLDLPDVELPVDPYLLGVWLGDGTSTRAEFTLGAGKGRLVTELRRRGVEVRVRTRTQRWPICYLTVGGRGDLIRVLRGMGVSPVKGIPSRYLRASIRQRLDLLRGIMDTDGCADRNGRCSIDVTCRPLAYGLQELLRSLGVKATYRTAPATLNGRTVGERYRFSFTTTVCPFLVSEKAARWVSPRSSGCTGRTIVAVNHTVTVPTRCFTVDAPSHTYLAGENMVPTHNSWLAARAVLGTGAAWPEGLARVTTTAYRYRFVTNALWPYIRGTHAGQNLPETPRELWLPGEIRQSPTWMIGRTLVADGFAVRDGDESAFSGIHANGELLVLVDEAGELPESVGRGINNLLGQDSAHALVIGNPAIDHEGTWFQSICESDEWHVIRISAFDAPWCTGEVTPWCTTCPPSIPRHRLAEHLVNEDWVQSIERSFGAESPYFISRVKGEFPTGSAAKVLPIAWLEDAKAHVLPEGPKDEIVLGVDVAAQGGDELVVCKVDGFRVSIDRKVAGKVLQSSLKCAEFILDSIVAAEQVMRARGMRPRVRVKIDANGVGYAIPGILEQMRRSGKHDAIVVPVIVSRRPRDRAQFVNQRDEMWWNVRRYIEPQTTTEGGTGEPVLDLSRLDEETIAQLYAPEYSVQSQQIKVERKDEIKKRLSGRSPDRGEAVCLALYEPPEAQAAGGRIRLPDMSSANPWSI